MGDHMLMQDVTSSHIAAVGYNAETRELYITFKKTGDTWSYLDVPVEIAHAFMHADSKGGYLANHIRPHFKAARVNFLEGQTKGRDSNAA